MTGLTADTRVLRSRHWSLRISRRAAVVCGILSGLLLVLLVAALMIGEYVVTPAALVQTLLGDPPARLDGFFVLGRRLPRALVAIVVGASLAVAGAVFQTLTRNPLASPDVIGISSGASVGAVAVFLVWGGSLDQAAIGAVVGALVIAAVIVLLTARSGLHGVQLILTGVALSAIAMAVVDYVLTQVFVASATTAQTWLVGSLQGRGWSDLVPAVIALALITPLLIRMAPDARMMALGDSVSTALGVRTVRARWMLLAAATVLVAIAVATAGPISFVALVAPHIARRLAGTPSFLAAALVGALLLLAGDLVAQYAFPAPIPVGAVTITIGGAFFLWLLWREGARRG
ncbi:iron chelate uptake ABC transporter family permease subunit [Streptomyces sp. AC495_CC817]|uniref:FecCD family ABC transporter permease n=1 Tax=Streptomyces sp. AC495_CC817 TaxID=2823900 RepID=UPI001C262306|nr:iron chelate uptake ABC transporter family permease subunit [Streptomyces sp. AC495_CC817]